MTVAASVLGAARQAVEELQGLTGAVAVVVATADGFDVASAVSRGIDPARVAAMASSISAIGAVVSAEGRLSAYRHVTVAAGDGFVHVQAVNRPDVQLVINVVGDASAVLAQVAYGAAQQARRLEAA